MGIKAPKASSGSPSGSDIEAIYAPVLVDLQRTEKLFEEVLATDNSFVFDMVKYLGKTQGKRVRAALTMLSYRACLEGRVDESSANFQQALVTAEAVELIHNATLVHDDVIDDSPIRRGQKTLNYQWGNEITVLMGDFIFARVFGLLARHVEAKVIQTISKATDRLCEGEIQEVRNRFLVTQNEVDYFDTIEKKTAALMAVASESASMIAGAPEETQQALRRFGLKLGVVFQLVDDLLDLTAAPEKLGKPNGHDLREGKLTLPVLRALSVCGKLERSRMQEILLKNEISDQDLSLVFAFIREHGGLDYARGRAQTLVDEAKAELAVLPEGRAKQSLSALADYMIHREF
ncbi:MAG: polyprenyl synthetase family protein [candidate division FCPU426 bacterium]